MHAKKNVLLEQIHAVLVTWFYHQAERFSQLLPAVCQRHSFSVSSSPCSHLVPYHRHRSLPVSPNPPSVSILPFPSCSSHSASVFVEEPVKVRPAAAVQTLMAPHRFLVDFMQAITIAQRFHYCHHGASRWKGAELAVRICDKMKMKESFRELRRNYMTGK